MYETQMSDSRQNMNALLTASIEGFIPGMKGATLANYVEFKDFIKNKEGKIEGAIVFDKIKKKEYRIKSKVVVNCTGIHSDTLRLQDNSACEERLAGARGTHLIFPKDLLSDHLGVIIPKTKDGRLIYMLNYQGHALVGTTDVNCPVTH